MSEVVNFVLKHFSRVQEVKCHECLVSNVIKFSFQWCYVDIRTESYHSNTQYRLNTVQYSFEDFQIVVEYRRCELKLRSVYWRNKSKEDC